MARTSWRGWTAGAAAWLVLGGALASCAPGGETEDEDGAKGSLTQELDVCVEEQLEPNDTRRSAAEIAFGGSPVEGSLCFRWAQDWYTFQGPPAGELFSVRLDQAPETYPRSVSAVLFDSAGNTVRAESSPTPLLTATSNGGRYYVQLLWNNVEPSGVYRLTTALGTLPRCDQQDPLEPNNSSSTATPLALEQTLSGFVCGYDYDYFRIPAPPTGTEFTVNVRFDGQRAPLATRLLWNAVSRVNAIPSRAGSNNESYVLTSRGGFYELSVASSYGGNNDYQVEALTGYHPASSCAGEDALEPNDRPEQASELVLGSSASALLCESLPDIFAVQGPPAGTPFYATANFTGPVNADLELLQVTPTGTTSVVTTSIRVPAESTSPAAHSLGAVSDGSRYLLRVTGDPWAERSYTAAFSLTPPACDGDESGEPNDALATARAAALPGSFSGVACANPDVFRFQGPPSKTRFEVEVLFRELGRGGARVQLFDTRGRVVSSQYATFGRVLLQAISNGGRYYVGIDPLAGETARYEVALREPARSCSIDAEISSLGAACGISNAGPLAAVTATDAASAPTLSENTSYTVTLSPSAVGNGGSLAFTATRTGSYAFFVGSPGVRLELRDAAGTELAPACLSSLEREECNKLRRVYRYELIAGERYLITFGPTLPQQFVRLLIAETEVSAIVCENPDLPERGRICDLNLPATSVKAAALGVDGPTLPKEQMTLVELQPTAAGFGGSVNFVPEVSGTYRLYLSAQLPAKVFVNNEELDLSCSRDLTAEECASFRKGFAMRLRAEVPVRVELDGSSVDSTRVFLTGALLLPEPACGEGELPDLVSTCQSPSPAALSLQAAPLSAEAPPAITPEVTTLVRLVTGATTNAGVVTITPPASGSYQLYLSAPHLPFRLYDDLEQIAATCTQPLSSTECIDFRRGSRFELSADHTYRLELGPVTPMQWVRVRLDSSND
ncbi:MAG: hypothetical protein ACOY0T_20710 [Myxococcota bacterium]